MVVERHLSTVDKWWIKSSSPSQILPPSTVIAFMAFHMMTIINRETLTGGQDVS